jgi:predicted ATPase
MQHGVVTLTGVGGVGKTRLALQVAAEVLPRHPDGAWAVELASVRDVAGVVEAVAEVFRLTGLAGQLLEDSLLEMLAQKQMLLVLDNCEHVLGTVARLVSRIERQCPGVTVLATSREGLGSTANGSLLCHLWSPASRAKTSRDCYAPMRSACLSSERGKSRPTLL